ncbi:MAG TPA: hypothetical protein VE974_13330 [Thermoanaerobaculia bacterium]|nr:hypothetical protein [Thermoanaerobaculia bacterium]
MKRLILALGLLLLLPQLASAAPLDFIRFDPAPVRENEPFDILMGGLWPSGAYPHSATTRIEGNRIIVHVDGRSDGPPIVVPWGERIRLSGLQRGVYNVEVVADDMDVGEQALVVLARAFSVTPPFGENGTSVLIEGIALQPCEEAPCPQAEVQFGATKSNDVRVTAEGDLLATVPAGSGLVDVIVRQNTATYTLPIGFRYGEPRTFEPNHYERVLFPLTFAGPGAHGSQWRSENIIRNDAAVEAATVPAVWDGHSVPEVQFFTPIPPGERAAMPEEPEDGGLFLYVPRGLEKWLTYSSHIVDRSRSASDRGSELPVIRVEDTSAEIRLLDIPLRPLYRAHLRVYDFDTDMPRNIRIVVTKEDGTNVFISRRIFSTFECINPPCFDPRPPYATIDLSSIPELANAGEVDISVRSDTNDARLWAFVSVSNNNTQHVTMYTPQHDTPEVVR